MTWPLCSTTNTRVSDCIMYVPIGDIVSINISLTMVSAEMKGFLICILSQNLVCLSSLSRWVNWPLAVIDILVCKNEQCCIRRLHFPSWSWTKMYVWNGTEWFLSTTVDFVLIGSTFWLSYVDRCSLQYMSTSSFFLSAIVHPPHHLVQSYKCCTSHRRIICSKECVYVLLSVRKKTKPRYSNL